MKKIYPLKFWTFIFKICTQSIACGLPNKRTFAVFLDFEVSSIDWIIPIGILGGNKVLAGEETTKSPTFIYELASYFSTVHNWKMPTKYWKKTRWKKNKRQEKESLEQT